ncbi:MAG TPA: class I SAM-dependent methyltransferase [Burkholderiaceae bacterium]|nr:class I SAM-dependent methyltransferase [Burkholderiaceae bacterium]
MNASSTFTAVDGDGYEQTMGRWSRRLAPQFLAFAGCRDGERVLDLGCGTGALGVALLQACNPARVQGVDFSPEYVAHARRAHTDARLAFRVGDACALDEADASYDRVLALLVLHFVPRTADAVAEMRRVARPGAVVAAAVWDARGGFVANRVFWDTAASLDPVGGGAARARNYTRPLTRPGELAAAWRAAGLREVQDTQLVVRMDFASFADYWGPYVGREGPGAQYVAGLDAEARGRLEAAVRAAYLDGEPDGPRSYAALAWAVRGVAPTA